MKGLIGNLERKCLTRGASALSGAFSEMKKELSKHSLFHVHGLSGGTSP
jgi:hypothetical protein